MQVAVRSYLTAGMTLVGAGAIALSPVAPSLPAAHMPTIHQAAVDLAAAAGPLETWVQVVTQSLTNVGQIGQQVIADPAPVLAQILTNQLANVAVLGHATEETITGITGFAQSLATNLPVALGQVAKGDILGAEATLLNIDTLIQLVGILQGPIDAYSVVTNTVQNFANLVGTLPGFVLSEGNSVAGVVWSAANAMAVTGQSVVDEAGAGDLGAVLGTLANAPAVMTGAVLNGYGNGPLGFAAPGLLTSLDNPLGSLGAGPIAVAIDFRKTFLAAALKPLPAPPTANALKAIDAAPATGTTLALSTGSAAAAPAADAPAAAAKPTKTVSTKTGAVKASSSKDDGTASAATPATDGTGKGKHRADTANPVKKLGDNIKKALGGSDKKAEHATAGASGSK
jgi:hypothetical protein